MVAWCSKTKTAETENLKLGTFTHSRNQNIYVLSETFLGSFYFRFKSSNATKVIKNILRSQEIFLPAIHIY